MVGEVFPAVDFGTGAREVVKIGRDLATAKASCKGKVSLGLMLMPLLVYSAIR
jgi:hypothetical protein